LVILDEACGILDQLWAATRGTTNAECRILAIGNPDDPNTRFAKKCRPGSGWNVIKISAFDTPASRRRTSEASRFETGDIDIDPYDDELASQLASIRYSFDSPARIKVESNDEMRKRGMPSPVRMR
jgi:hypothetical protein